MEKLEKIRAIGGLSTGCALDADDLEDDFDPEEYDKKMGNTFNDDYYNAEDADFVNEEDNEDGDIEKPDFDKEDELLGLPKDCDIHGASDGFAAIRKKSLKSKTGTKGVKDDEHGVDGDDFGLHKDMEEYDKMDHEGTIGELKTRFKYVRVAPQRFEMSAKSIIMMDDKKLSQYVPLKKIAPYAETEWTVPKKLRNQMKMEIKLMKQEFKSKYGKAPKNHAREGSRTLEPVAEEKESVQVEEVNGGVGEPSKKRKRKDRMKEVKPSKQRCKAYGVGDPQPKKNRN
ncbi:hypothetical protein MKW94_012299 [Papaver nudicaule]|uniref:Kri1-like C-terminal domain-containing protein n=1 Tax=Papaver nudicaule TaxID=74823 RepID=A0AA41W2C0_PAPNU|nr:hypothetical protein [Papaver nudicaule]